AAVLTATIFRGFRSWQARRANGSLARAEQLLPGFQPTKSLRGEPLLEGPPPRYDEEMRLILYGLAGLMFGWIGVYLLLGAFGIVGPLYTNTP
ncbi:MAG: hypothetical protein ACRDNO_34475, partial [Trebonia sp.]